MKALSCPVVMTRGAKMIGWQNNPSDTPLSPHPLSEIQKRLLGADKKQHAGAQMNT